MESADAKLARAKVHLSAFQHDAAVFAERARPEFIRKTDADKHWLVYFVKDANPPFALGAVIGDFLFNLRSCLDSTICGLVRRKDRSKECETNQFPIFDDSLKYQQARDRYLRDVDDDARKVCDQLQPFNRPDATLDPLWILNRLCNTDKHRSIHLTLCYHRDMRLLIPMKDGRAIYLELPRDTYAGEVNTAMLPGHPDSVADDAHFKIAGRTVLMFRDSAMMSERPVDEILAACLNYVENHVLPRFVPFVG